MLASKIFLENIAIIKSLRTEHIDVSTGHIVGETIRYVKQRVDEIDGL